MNNPATFEEGDSAGGEIQLAMNAVMLYEDLSAGLRGKEVLDYTARLFPGSPHFNLAIWRFDVLRAAVVRKLALQKASVADVLVLSADGRRVLPKVVARWLRDCLDRKMDKPCALLVSLNEDSRDSASAAQIIFSLQAEANGRELEVFPHFSKKPRFEGNPNVQTIQRRPLPHTRRLDDNWHGPELQSHWGINE